MTQFIITYLSLGQPASAEERRQQFAKYQQWLASLGDAAIKPMVPFKNVHTIHPDGSVTPGSSVSMSGHTVIQAESIEAAVALAKNCPFLENSGSLEVAELVQLPG
ncbi:MAG: hypothetical protein V7752_11835 [Halopseudomonas sp.]